MNELINAAKDPAARELFPKYKEFHIALFLVSGNDLQTRQLINRAMEIYAERVLNQKTCVHDYHTFFNKRYRKCNKCGHEYII